MDTLTPEQCVINGAAVLDSGALDFHGHHYEFPEDWRDKINLDTLDIEERDRCILGQLLMDPEDPKFAMGFPNELVGQNALAEFGFITSDEGSEDMDYDELWEKRKEQYAALTKAWREYLDGCRV